MPGDTRSKTVVIAAEMAFGNCQNCSVLHQSLNEYVSSFLALKKKITFSDESIRLRQQLEEMQIRLVTLEKKSADYESLQGELEEKKEALKSYGQMIEAMEKFKQENCIIMAEKNQLEDQLKETKELMQIQSLENSRLTREKALVENDLLKTQASLNKSQAQADQVEKLIEENFKVSEMKDALENKVRLLEDSLCARDRHISHLTKCKILLQGNIDDLQARVLTLERERTKEYRSTSAQANAPEEPKVDKEKVRMLLENLWACVEPQQQCSTNPLHFPEICSKQVLPSAPEKNRLSYTSLSACPNIGGFNCNATQTKATYAQAELSLDPTTFKNQAYPQPRSAKKKTNSPKKSKQLSKEHKTEDSSMVSGSHEVSVAEIMALFKPLLPCISPLPDLETDMPSMDKDIGEKESPSKNLVPLHQGESLLSTISRTSLGPKSFVVPTEENECFMDMRTKKVEQVSCGNQLMDLGQNELGDITEIIDKIGTDEEMHHEKDLKTKQEPTTLQLVSASSLSSISDTVQVVGVMPSMCVENGLGKSKGDQSGTFTNMDVDDTKKDTSDDRELSKNNMSVIPEKCGNVQRITSSTTEYLKESEITKTEKCSKVIKTPQDSCGFRKESLNVTVLKSPEKKECVIEDIVLRKDIPCLSSSSSNIGNVSNGSTEERIKKDESTKPLSEQDVNEKQETGAGDLRMGHSDSTDDNRQSARTPLFKMEVVGSHNDLKSEQANVKIPSKIDVGTENLNGDHGALPSDSRTKTLQDSGSRQVHCGSLRPSSLFPTAKSKTLETDSNPSKLSVGANIELLLTNKSPVPLPNLDEESTSKKAMGQLNKCKLDTVVLMNSSKQDCATTNEQKTQVYGNDKLRPHINHEEEPSSVEGSATTQLGDIGSVLSEMGPPLPCLLTPLNTPPKVGKSISPSKAIEKLSFPSPMASPTTPISIPSSKQLTSSSLDSPVPPTPVPSSPLQFGSATPKHAVPVPGRFPSSGMISSPLLSSSPSQENSMRMLDTMYPGLSAHARTLSILKGNVSFSKKSENETLPEKSTIQISGFKAINSTSTAFTKTEVKGEKRPPISLPESKNSKCLRLDNCSFVSHNQVPASSSDLGEDMTAPRSLKPKHLMNEPASPPTAIGEPAESIVMALNKIENQCFDLLPVLQSRVYVGNLPKKPVLRNEEKEVIADICQSRLADDLILAILNKLKAEKRELSNNYVQALCRVYTGICRQKRDWEKALLLAYSILTEDFPDAAKLILFMVTTWPNVLSRSSSLCQAIHAVTKLKAQENLLSCLTAFLGWEKSPPCNIEQLISSTLSDVKSGSCLSFTKHSRHGDDLGSKAWEYILTLHILCAHKKWEWTYENLLSKELWPLMNLWMTQAKDQKELISNVTVATVLRLIGLLGQLGIKERRVSSVVTVASIINTFGRHGPTEGVPWEVQLAAIFSIYDLSPCNPRQALDALAGWRGETSVHVPPAVTSCINQLASICRQVNC
ncbi:little elongation complex subunit 1 [Antennarius striatus]|uniref:little elongation complex subunit 1 n=1 Tax=Antennarius striatus TaxID=241820 RepID=UPI0035AF27FD